MSMYHEGGGGGQRGGEGERSCTLVVYRDELKRIRVIYDCTPSHTMPGFPLSAGLLDEALHESRVTIYHSIYILLRNEINPRHWIGN